jgi:hypothetical protein
MCLQEAIAYQRGRTGVEYKINILYDENKRINTDNFSVMALIFGPDSLLYAPAKRLS